MMILSPCFGIFQGEGDYLVIRKKPIIIIGIILALLFFGYWTSWRFERVNILANTSVRYLNDYQDYFHRTEVVFRRTLVGTTASRQIIYFSRGQRNRMLERIKEDVKYELASLIEEHSDIFYRYEISDDFTHIRIYETPGGIGRSGFFDLRPSVIMRMHSLVGLYHSVRLRRSASIPSDYTFEIRASRG